MGISKRPFGPGIPEFGKSFGPGSGDDGNGTEDAPGSPDVLPAEADVPVGPLLGLLVDVVLNRRKAAKAAASLGVDGPSLSLEMGEWVTDDAAGDGGRGRDCGCVGVGVGTAI
jgi:hypothetical protein